MIGESNVNVGMLVATTAPTVIVVVLVGTVCCPAGAALTTIDVDDVHAEVRDTIADSRVVEVNSYAPKLRPVTVTDEAPDIGTLRYKYDSCGASKENRLTLQPASEATVTVATPAF